MALPLEAKPTSPTFNTGHAQYSGLVRCVLFHEGTGSPVELIGSGTGTLETGATWTTDTDMGLNTVTCGTGDDKVNFGDAGLSHGNGDCTVYLGLRAPTVAALYHTPWQLGGTGIEKLACGVTDNGDWYFVLNDVVEYAYTTTTDPTPGNIYTVGFAYDRLVDVRCYAYNQTSSTLETNHALTAGGTPGTGGTACYIGNHQGLASGWGEEISFCYMWNRVLATSEFDVLNADPWAFFSDGAPTTLQAWHKQKGGRPRPFAPGNAR